MKSIQKILVLVLMALVVFQLPAQNRRGKSATISGTVVDKKTNKPVEAAVIVLSPAELYTTTDKNGEFTFANVEAGNSVINIQFIGMETIEEKLTVEPGKAYNLNFALEETNFRLTEVNIVATASKAGNSTASNISRQAMDHLQTSSLSDVMQLLPGAAIVNPDISSKNIITLRSAFDGVGSNSSYGNSMNSLGTAVLVDGSPLSNNANLQLLASTINGEMGNTGSGADIRTISTDNIESVEVIRGIPSVEYGDLTSGAVIIKSKAGKEPLNVRLKANSKTYQVSASKGLSLGSKWGNLNITGDYAYNTSSLYKSYVYYQRANLKFLWSNQFTESFRATNSIDLGLSKDSRDLNPDDLRTKTVSEGKSKSIRLASNGTWDINHGWLKSLSYNASVSYKNDYSYMQELLSNAEALYSTCVTDGAILSNLPGQDIFDIDGNKITNIPAGDMDKWIKVLPYEYTSIYEIKGKELNAFAQVKLDLNKRWGNTNNHILFGADYKTDGNLGEGQIYDDEFPPMRPAAGGGYASYRKRAFKDIPFIHQVGIFAENTFNHSFGGTRDFIAKIGARYDNINGKSIISPRINASMEIIPEAFTIRGGWGITAKAPTALMLYPDDAYFNFNNYDYQAPDGTRTTVATIRKFETKNDDLKIAKMRKAEVGFDVKLFNKIRFSVTAYDELMENGYVFGKDLSCWQLVPFTRYNAVKNASGEYVPQLDRTYNIFASFSKPFNNIYSHNKGIEYELDLGRIDAIRTSFYIDGAYTSSKYRNEGASYTYNSNSNNLERHVGIYQAGMMTRNKEKFVTTVRITHNIPEIGFVVTLATQINWMEKFWTEYLNDTAPLQYISYADGKVYAFEDWMKTDPNYSYMVSSVADTRFIAEKYFPTVTFNLNLSKEIGDKLTASFYVNNMFYNQPLYESKANPGSFTNILEDNKLFFGFDLKFKIR